MSDRNKNDNTPKQEIKEPRKDKPKEDLKIEDNLELSQLSKHERKKVLRQRLKAEMADMTTKEKIRHFFTYYAGKFFALLLAAVIVIFMAVTVIKNNRPIVLSYAIINSPNSYALDTSVLDDGYIDFYDFSGKQQVKSQINISVDLDTCEKQYEKNPNDIAFTGFPAACADNYYDIIISDKKGVEYCAAKSLIYPLETALPSNLYETFTSDEYKDRLFSANGSDNNAYVFAIDISDTDFAKSLHLGYEDIYICFPGNSDANKFNVKQAVNYIFALQLDEE